MCRLQEQVRPSPFESRPTTIVWYEWGGGGGGERMEWSAPVPPPHACCFSSSSLLLYQLLTSSHAFSVTSILTCRQRLIMSLLIHRDIQEFEYSACSSLTNVINERPRFCHVFMLSLSWNPAALRCCLSCSQHLRSFLYLQSSPSTRWMKNVNECIGCRVSSLSLSLMLH